MANIYIEDENLLNQANYVLKEINFNMPSVIDILLNRIISEKSINFLLPNAQKNIDKSKYEEIYNQVTKNLIDNLLKYLQNNMLNHEKENIRDQEKNYYSNNEKINRADKDIKNNNKDNEENTTNKGKAIEFFSKKGYYFNSRNTTFASKNDTVNYYWANPDVELLKDDWYLILNDYINKKYYLFNIPKGSLHVWELKFRADQENKIDLQILYNDNSFEDSRSKIEFRKYFIGEFSY